LAFARRILDWHQIIADNFTEPADQDKQVVLVNRAAVKVRGVGATPYGAVAMNFSQAVKEAFVTTGILPSHIGPVIQTIKDSGKAIQLGRGKGKIIVLLDPTLFGADHPVKGIDPTDATELAKAVAATGTDVIVLKKENLELKQELDAARTTIAELRETNNLRYRITWT
jgi:hypothetical protein